MNEGPGPVSPFHMERDTGEEEGEGIERISEANRQRARLRRLEQAGRG